jgi:hypothetical protein
MPRASFILRLIALALWCLSSVAKGANDTSGDFHLRLTVSRAADRGENWGSLFEITDASGNSIAGAGYLGAYNTFYRSDRDELHVFVRTVDTLSEWRIERLPRIESTATGFYPFQLAGNLYAAVRNGSDSTVHRWDAESETWQVARDVPSGVERIAGKVLHVSPEQVTWDGRTLLMPDEPYRFGEHYFADGKLILRTLRSDDRSPANKFIVFSWNPANGLNPRPLADLTLALPQPREFVYAFGQWRNHILAITNMGGVYRLRGNRWDILHTPDPNVSYQIYSALNYRDKLLLGHYPTGEIYEYAGDQLVLKKDWPPALRGVSRSAREAQTLAIYNGELHVGVWPWGEVWRYDGADWQFVQRMFSHPPLTDAVTHPYETETKQVDDIYNLWGQRVTGLVPFGGSLIITTSSKGGSPWEPKFAFLAADKRLDYGAIYRATLPGQFSVHAPITETSTRIELRKESEFLIVFLNGIESARIRLSPDAWTRLIHGKVRWGHGIYGPCRLSIESHNF